MTDLPDGFVLEQPNNNQQAAPALPDGFTLEHPSMWKDVAKSAASGLENGTADALGLPGNLATLAHAVAPQAVTDAIKRVPGAQWLYNHLPTSQAVLNSGDPLVDPNYQPDSAAGRYTKAISEAAGPGLATGMGVLPTLGSAVGGQAASDLTGGNPYAAFGGSVLGGFAGPMALARLATGGRQALQDAAAIKAAANANYADPALKAARLRPQAVQDLAFDMRDQLANASTPFMPAQAQRVHSAIDALDQAANPVNGAGAPRPVTIADLHSFRKTLGKIGNETQDFKPTEQAVAAQTAKKVLDQYLDNVPTHDVVAGDPTAAVNALRDANGNWRAQASANKVGDLIGNAINQNDTTHSAMNLGNILRQKMRPLLDNNAAKLKAMGYGLPEINAVRQVTKGDLTTNLLRRASNMLGGGGGIGSAIVGHAIGGAAGGTAGYEEGGLPGMLIGSALGAVPGQVLRVMANARTLNAAKAVQQGMLKYAPANEAINKVNNAVQAGRLMVYRQGGRNAVLQADLQAKKYNNGN